jgi:hypothetical protein
MINPKDLQVNPIPKKEDKEEKEDKKEPVDVLALLKAKNAAQAPGPTQTDGPKEAAIPAPKAPAPLETRKLVSEKETIVTAPVPKKHAVKVWEQNDTNQLYPFLTECSCGFQARSFTKEAAKQAEEQHISNAAQPSKIR